MARFEHGHGHQRSLSRPETQMASESLVRAIPFPPAPLDAAERAGARGPLAESASLPHEMGDTQKNGSSPGTVSLLQVRAAACVSHTMTS